MITLRIRIDKSQFKDFSSSIIMRIEDQTYLVKPDVKRVHSDTVRDVKPILNKMLAALEGGYYKVRPDESIEVVIP